MHKALSKRKPSLKVLLFGEDCNIISMDAEKMVGRGLLMSSAILPTFAYSAFFLLFITNIVRSGNRIPHHHVAITDTICYTKYIRLNFPTLLKQRKITAFGGYFVGTTLAVVRGRFPHSQPFPYHDELLPLLPDRGKPCPYDLFSNVYANPSGKAA